MSKPTRLVSRKGNVVEATDPVAINNLLYGHGYRLVEDAPVEAESKTEVKSLAKAKTTEQGSDTPSK